MKYVVVTGGVVSGLGKGITISSIGRILKSSGVRITAIKIDPYMNVDAGTMSPFEHGETFVLDDGGETDLDLGNYERFLDITLTARHNITTGKVYREVIEKERRGDYLGKTVQIVPHATDLIISWIKEVSQLPVDGTTNIPDVCLIEVGGTVGDIESMIFLEALRQMRFLLPLHDMIFIHLSLVPVLGVVGEQKTKPTQHSVKELRSVGISPDMIICRSSDLLDASTKNKLSIFCQIHSSHVFSVHDVSNIYYVPLILQEQGIHTLIKQHLCLPDSIMTNQPNFLLWTNMANIVDEIELYTSNSISPTLPAEGTNELPSTGALTTTKKIVNIAFVGKYTGLQDSYLSVLKSLKHSSIHLKVKVQIQWIEASDLEPISLPNPIDATTSTSTSTSINTIGDAQDSNTHENQDDIKEKKRKYDDAVRKYETAWNLLKSADGILVPGGFGNRGVEGKIAAAQYARTHGVPYLGLCLGMQVMVIEYARHVANLSQANSSEFDENTPHPVIIFMPEINQHVMGGTMRLGSRPTSIYTHYPSSSSDSSASQSSSTLLIQIPSSSSSSNNNNHTLACDIYSTHSLDHESSQNSSPVHAILERHRHRYEVNPSYVQRIQEAGLFFSGVDDKLERMEIAELPRTVHPFYFGTQFHPEFKSRPNRPSPPVFAFIAVAAGLSDQLGYAGDMWQKHVNENQLQTLEALPPTPFRVYATKMISSSQSLSRSTSSSTAGATATGGDGSGGDINNEISTTTTSIAPLEKKRSVRAWND